MNDDRQMFQGSWTCAGCGGEITELPFQPDPERAHTLKCRDCHKKDRDSRDNRGPRQDRQMYTGDWSCADCGGKIDKLPFEPRDTSNLKCRDCFRK